MGSRLTDDGVERVYDAAQAWVDSALRTDGSLFTPGTPIWSSHWLRELRELSPNNLDESPDSFEEKLRRKLEGSSPEIYQLFGEALYFHYLVRRSKSDANKLQRINMALEWSPAPVQIPAELADSLTPGILNPGQLFNSTWLRQAVFLVEFVEQWKQVPDRQQHMLEEEWEFKNFVIELDFRSEVLQMQPNTILIQREALLHLVFPDTFEAIVSVNQKEKIVKAFANLVRRPVEDVDRKLAQIRSVLETQYESGDHFFFLPEIRVQWDEQYKQGPIDVEEQLEVADSPLRPSVDPWSQPITNALAAQLLWKPEYLQEIIRDLQEKRQVIFHGPPGTGKTYVAREIAKQCRDYGGDFEIVQFHPSYSYEDFVEGFRPKLIGDQAGFDLVHGPLRRIAQKASLPENSGKTFILVIDELNRGNVAKVFGELYFLLEYRDEEVRLLYGDQFSLPSNLWFICTMNTADRSIALMDAALRRRFYFAPFFPDEPPIKGLLNRWLEREGKDTLAARLVDEANKSLDRDARIGPSYFMRPGQTLDEDSVRRIWGRAVMPYIEEQCFGDDAKLNTFKFDALKRRLGSEEPVEDLITGESAEEQGNDATPGAG